MVELQVYELLEQTAIPTRARKNSISVIISASASPSVPGVVSPFDAIAKSITPTLVSRLFPRLGRIFASPPFP